MPPRAAFCSRGDQWEWCMCDWDMDLSLASYEAGGSPGNNNKY